MTIPSLQHLHKQIFTDAFWKHSALMILMVLIGKSLSFLWKVALAQYGPEALGLVQLSLVTLTLLSNLALLGLQTTVIRFITVLRQRNKNLEGERILFFTFRLSMILAVVLMTVILIFPEKAQHLLQLHALSQPYIRLLVLAVPIFVSIELLLSYFNATHQILTYGLGKYVLQPFFRLMLLLAVLVFHVRFEWGINIHLLLSSLFACIILLFVSQLWRKLSTQPGQLTSQLRNQFLTYSFPVAGSFLLFILYGSADTVLLSRHASIGQVGLLGALVLLIELADAFFLPSLNLLYAHLGKYEKHLSGGVNFVFHTISVFLIIAAAVFVLMTVFRSVLIEVILGPEYLVLVGFVLPFLAAKLIESAVVFPLRHLLDFYGYVKLTFAFMAVTLFIKLSVGNILIARLGISGLVFTTIIANSVHAALCLITVFWLFQKASAGKSE